METYDCIVLGTGGAGSAALYHLSRRGARVLGIDRFPPGHDRGSSHGVTRIIRQAYFEHPDYVPLLIRAYQLWKELAERCGRRLYHEVGLLEVGPPGGTVVPGVLKSARQHGLPVEELSAAEAGARFPGFRFPEGMSAVFERRAGYLLVEECVRAHCEEALKLGARLQTGEEAREWRPEGRGEAGSGVEVKTEKGTYRATRLVIAPGAWAGDLLADLAVPFHLRRKPLLWYRTSTSHYRVEAGCPCFLHETPAGIFYGFPEIDRSGLKAAEHTGGEPVADPFDLDRSLRPSDRRPVEAFLRGNLPEVTTELLKHAVCMYPMSPDENFVVDRHPRWPQVVFAAGLSGHGFKFTSVLGEVLAELALEGRTALPVDFLRSDRPGLRWSHGRER